MAFASNGQYGPEAIQDLKGNALPAATITGLPVGYTATVNPTTAELIIVGPPTDALTFTINPPVGAPLTKTVVVPPRISELNQIRDIAFASGQSATGVVFTPAAGIAATNVQAAIQEVVTDANATYAKVVPVTTATSAGLTAAAALAGVDGCVYVPAGMTVTLSTPVALTDVGLQMAPGSVLNVPVSLGVGVAALTLAASASGNIQLYDNVTLRGSYTRVLGVSGNVGDGIKINGNAKAIFRHLNVQKFDSGVILNNNVGHLYFYDVNITNNYYGVYLTLANSDYHWVYGEVNGNTFANFACTAAHGFGAVTIIGTHCGFAPYGFYQEATPAAQGINRVFMQECTFRHARFEAIGNAAIWSDATDTGTDFSQFADIIIENPGFSWAPEYKVGALPQTYAIKVGTTARNIEIIDGPAPFMAGTSGIFYANTSSHTSWTRRGSSGALADLTIGTGSKSYFAPRHSGDDGGRKYITQRYYSAPGARSTGSRPQNFMTLIPFYVETPTVFDALAVSVTAAGAGSTVRLGVYGDTNGAPGVLIVDAGTVATATTGLKAITGLTISLMRGWHYLACAQQGSATTPTCRTFNAGTVVVGMPIDTNGGTDLQSGAGFVNTSVSGALPSPANASGTTDAAIAVAIRAL